MKKFKLAVILFIFGATFLHANDFNVWIAPEYTLQGTGFTHDVLNGNDKLITHYDVDKDFFSYIGAEAGFSWRFISIQGQFDWGIPKNCGQTVMDKHNASLENIICEHREYNNSFDAQNFNIDTKLQFDFPVIKNWFNVRPYLGFSYNFAKYNLGFASGREGISNNYDYRKSAYEDTASWEIFTRNIDSGNDIWFKREQYDIKTGVILHGTFFNRFFVDAEGTMSPFFFLNHKQTGGGENYYLDIMKGNFCKWAFGAGAGVYLGPNNCFEIGTRFNYSFINTISGDSYHSKSENSGFEKYTGNDAGTHAETSFNSWKISLYGKYTFTFGPTYVPKVREPREPRIKKEKAPKVRKGKVDVIQY